MSKITTHVLDISLGRPAADVPVVLELQSVSGSWSEIGHGVTDGDGRMKDLAAGKPVAAGVYRITFDTGAYFTKQQLAGFYPKVIIVFEVKDGQEHYHIPLLLSPFGYSTYRGS